MTNYGKAKLEDLSIDELRKRKKTASILLYILIAVVILSIIVFAVSFIMSKQVKLGSLVPTFACIGIGLVLCGGIRKIDEELQRRKSK